MEVAEMVKDMDWGNKKFLEVLNADNVKAASMLALTAIVVFGGQVVVNLFTDNEEDQEIE